MAQDAPDVFHMGGDTLRVSRSQLHGKTRQGVLDRLWEVLPQKEQRGIALLQGGGPFHIYTSDGEGVFRQDSYMFYLFGANEDGWYGAIDVRTGKSVLFMPRLPEVYAVWMGELKSTDYYKAKYAVDEVHYVDEMAAWLKASGAPHLHVLSGTNTDSGSNIKPASFEGSDEFVTEKETLFDAITECRVFKYPEEVEIIRYCNKVAGDAHVRMMQECKPGSTMEYQLESTFLAHCYSHGGCRTAMYTPIAATGPNGAVLHYGHAGAPNDRQVQDGDMCLIDMGCSYYQYGSDITACWPANGRFTKRQGEVYSAVLRAHEAVKAAMRPGVSWPDMHTLANRIILEDLKTAGIVTGDIHEMMDHTIGALFMPHGLGHFLGLDTHDVGGYAPGGPARDTRPGYKSLRTARTLKEGMVITVEPGCYFNAALLLPALEDPVQSKYLVREALLPLIGFGGVRIEDNVLVTADGAESQTVNVPRSVADVERVMAGGKFE